MVIRSHVLLIATLCMFSTIVPSYVIKVFYDCSELRSNFHISSFVRYERFVKQAAVREFGA